MSSETGFAPRRPDVTAIELIGGVQKRELVLEEHDDAWATRFREHHDRIRAAIGEVGFDVDHIGSTSVPGLAAKPIVDVLVTVPDITAEEDYVEPLVDAGYLLRVREPGHRMLRTPELDVHVHVCEPHDPAVADYLLLRDHLRTEPADRRRYEQTKRELITRDWPHMDAYADAKSDVIAAVKDAARRSIRSETTIRPGRAGDVDAIVEVGRRSWSATYTRVAGPDYVRTGLERWWRPEDIAGAIGRGRVLVAEHRGQVIGMAAYSVDGGVLDLWKLYLMPKSRGLGVGSMLMRALLEGPAATLRSIRLAHLAGNDEARGFYERQGFVETHRSADHLGGLHNVWMERTV